MISSFAMHFQNTVPLAWYSAYMNDEALPKNTRSEFSVAADDTVSPASNVQTVEPDEASRQ